MFNFELMRIFLLIFALLIASCDVNEPIPCKSVAIQISDANPVQFWPVDCQTYNEYEACGVHHKCWCHPWQCDDEIPVQFVDTDFGTTKDLEAYNSDGDLLFSQAFETEDQFLTEFDLNFVNPNFTLNLANWGNYSGSPGTEAGWTWNSIGPLGVAQADGTSGTLHQTYELYQQRVNLGVNGYDKYPPGDYVFKINLSNESTGGSSPLTEGLYLQATDTLGVFGEAIPSAITIPRGGGFTDYTVNFTITQPWKYFTIYFYKQGPGSGSVIKIYINSFNIESYPLDYTNTVYSSSFVPSQEDICDEQINLIITNPDESPSDLYKSDCLDIATVQKCTTLIEYSNNRNFAGLVYTGVSPEQTFNIRVPAIFFHEQFPEEDEAMELTTGIQKTSGTMKVQRLFETDYMPYYMHKKLKLIFKHQFITIDNASWLKEEPYDVQEGDRRWPVKKAKCFLTENYIQRAVL